MNLHNYDIVICNSSGGKDSVVAIWEICRLAEEQNYPKEKIVVSHQDLGQAEWAGTKELAAKQAELFGLKIYFSKRIDKDGKEETLLEYAERRGKWPSNKQRWCTSDFKRGPGFRVVTKLTKGMDDHKVLYVFGFRKEESPSRKKKEELVLDTTKSTKIRQKDGKRKREVWVYLPVHNWATSTVWEVIGRFNLPYHYAYDLGMPRLSCVFCIFSPFDALVIGGRANPEKLDEYVAAERRMGHSFRADLWLKDVKKAIEDGYEPKTVQNWVM